MEFVKFVNKTLDELGIPCNLLGRNYLLEAIKIFRENPGIKTCQIYKDVAALVNTTNYRAERSIRHAIERGFDNLDPETIFRYFGNTISPSKGKPTIGQFISRICHLYETEE